MVSKVSPLIITLASEIGSFGKINSMLSEVEALNRPIDIHICSEGGDFYQGLALADRIRNLRVPVSTTIYGCCMSAAIIPYLAAPTRYMGKLAWVMLHELSYTTNEDGEKLYTLASETEHLKKAQRLVYKFMEEVTNKSARYWENLEQKGETYLSSEECLKLGICTHII